MPASASVEDAAIMTLGGLGMVVIAGIDVGKRSLEVSVAEGPVRRFHNTASGIHQLLSHLVEQGGTPNE